MDFIRNLFTILQIIQNKRIVSLSIFLILFISSVFSALRDFSNSYKPFDFHSYWYAGHFIWRGEDPYQAAFENREITPPITYLDGITKTKGSDKQYDNFMPANTAPVVLLLASLSRFSWPTATMLWAIINYVLALLLAGLVTQLVGRPFISLESGLIFFILISLIATRDAIRLGQTTILILVCMVASIVLIKKHSFLAGLFLGIALSKYSLSFPVLLLFAYKRWYFPLVISIFIQMVGGLSLMSLCHMNIVSLSTSYLKVMMLHIVMKNLTNAFPSLENLSWLVIGIGTFVVGGLLIYWGLSQRHQRQNNLVHQQTSVNLADLTLLNIGIIWDLLALYHRLYDNTAIILFLGLIIFCTKSTKIPMNYDIVPLERRIIYAIVAICCIFWLFPLLCINFLGFESWLRLFVWSNVIALALSIWLLFRTDSVKVD